jgi:hypothetical protein
LEALNLPCSVERLALVQAHEEIKPAAPSLTRGNPVLDSHGALGLEASRAVFGPRFVDALLALEIQINNAISHATLRWFE